MEGNGCEAQQWSLLYVYDDLAFFDFAQNTMCEELTNRNIFNWSCSLCMVSEHETKDSPWLGTSHDHKNVDTLVLSIEVCWAL